MAGRRMRADTRLVEIRAKISHLRRLDRAEDELLLEAAQDAHLAERHADRALARLAAAKRVDAMQDQVIDELEQEQHTLAGDVTAMTAEILGAARERATHPIEAGNEASS